MPRPRRAKRVLFSKASKYTRHSSTAFQPWLPVEGLKRHSHLAEKMSFEAFWLTLRASRTTSDAHLYRGVLAIAAEVLKNNEGHAIRFSST